jgi:hypothetical protein
VAAGGSCPDDLLPSLLLMVVVVVLQLEVALVQPVLGLRSQLLQHLSGLHLSPALKLVLVLMRGLDLLLLIYVWGRLLPHWPLGLVAAAGLSPSRTRLDPLGLSRHPCLLCCHPPAHLQSALTPGHPLVAAAPAHGSSSMHACETPRPCCCRHHQHPCYSWESRQQTGV